MSTSSRLSGRVIAISIGAALGGFLFGFDSSVINGAVDALSGDFGLGTAVTGFVVASALLGSAVGAWFAGPLADRRGRIPVMLSASVLFLASALGSAFAADEIQLTLWRILGGIAVGLASVIAPAYIAEVAPSSHRGRLASLQQLAIVLGIFTALLSDQVFATTAGGASQELWFGMSAWRWMLLAEAVPAIIYGVAAMRLPESPRYLVSVGRLDEAQHVLEHYVGVEDAKGAVAAMDAADGEAERSLRDLRGPALGLQPIVWVGIVLAVLQQFVGINVIFYYSTTLWQAVGFDESQAFTTSTITSVTNIAVTLVAISLVDRIGRRALLLIGSVGMSVSLLTMTVAFANATVGTDGSVGLEGGWAMVAFLAANGFVVFFGASWGPVVWVMLSEMFPVRIRATALAVAAAAQWLANFAVTMTFPPLAEVSLTLAYGIYAAMAIVSFFFVRHWVQETKGKSLEEISGAVSAAS